MAPASGVASEARAAAFELDLEGADAGGFGVCAHSQVASMNADIAAASRERRARISPMVQERRGTKSKDAACCVSLSRSRPPRLRTRPADVHNARTAGDELGSRSGTPDPPS